MLQATSALLPFQNICHASESLFDAFSWREPVPTSLENALDMLIDRSSADDGAHHAAREPRFVERRVLALRFEIGGIEHPRYLGIDHDDVGGRARAQRSARQPQ